MSKQKSNVPAKAETNTPAVAAGANVPAFMADKAKADVGKGASQEQDDNLVPLIYILQALSPQVQERNPEYIKGAKPGDIWLRNAPEPIVAGEEGFLFQPCYFTKDWVEWKPQRGGYAGRHDQRPADAVERPDPQDAQRMIWVRPNGNIVQETRYHIGYVINEKTGAAMPFVIPFKGAGHTVSRQWMFSINSKVIPDVEGPAPAWSCYYRLKTKFRTNAKGEFFVLDPSDAGWVETEAEYTRGQKLYEGFAAGAHKIETPQEDEGGQRPAGDNEAM